MPETENCGCPDGTFAYDITFPDIAGEPAPSLEEIEGRIASKFGLTGNDVFNAPRLSSASYYTHMDSPTDGVGDIRLYFEGDRLCLPGDSVVMGYTSPCNPPIEEIDVEMFFMLMELMDYAELLAVSASSNPDMVLNPAQYQLFQSGFVGEAAIQAYFLAFNLDYLDSDNPMISAAFGDINLRMGDAPWNISLASDANELDINAIIDLLGLLVDVAESEVGANDRSVQNAQCLITQYDQAIEQDSEFLERLEQARTSLEAWKPNAENDLVLLDSLLGKIDRMWENDILAGVWVGDIIQAFQRFHDNMQARHDLLSEMDASLERIDFLAMTPDQRINYARMEQIHYVLMNWGLTPCPFDMTTDWETFYACAVEAINMGLEAGNPGILTLIQPGNNGTAENYIDNLSHSITTDPYDDEVRQAEFERTMARTFFALGFVPVVGAFIDFVNALVALSQGNYSEAFWNFLFVAIDFDDFVRLGQRMGLLNGIADDFIQRADGELDEYVPILNDSEILPDN